MGLTWIDAYVEARVAFGAHPDVRICVLDARFGVVVEARERIGEEILALRYVVSDSEGPLVIRWAAERACARWEHELAKREPSEPFDIAALRAHAYRHGADRRWPLPCEVRVNQAWGKEMRMRLEDGRVVVSPVAYHELLCR